MTKKFHLEPLKSVLGRSISHYWSSCSKYRKWCSHFENRYYHAEKIEKKTINFSVSPCCILLFPRKENIKFAKMALVAVNCSCLVNYLMFAWISVFKYYQYYSGYLLACGNLLSSVLEELTSVLLVSF